MPSAANPTPASATFSVEDCAQFVGTCDMGDCDYLTEAIVFDGEAWLSACRACAWRWSVECRHCGRLPEADGDHSCLCPYNDAECPDHPSQSAPAKPSVDAVEGHGVHEHVYRCQDCGLVESDVLSDERLAANAPSSDLPPEDYAGLFDYGDDDA